MVYLFLAEGFEEIEALAPLDILRRGNIEVKTVGIGEGVVTGGHNISVKADILDTEVKMENIEAMILPGGGLGTENLEKSKIVQDMITYCVENNILIAAICAAPSILGHKGLLKGKKAISFPSVQDELEGAIIQEDYVVRDENIITARGMGVSIEFGLEILAALKGRELSDEVKSSIQYGKK